MKRYEKINENQSSKFSSRYMNYDFSYTLQQALNILNITSDISYVNNYVNIDFEEEKNIILQLNKDNIISTHDTIKCMYLCGFSISVINSIIEDFSYSYIKLVIYLNFSDLYSDSDIANTVIFNKGNKKLVELIKTTNNSNEFKTSLNKEFLEDGFNLSDNVLQLVYKEIDKIVQKEIRKHKKEELIKVFLSSNLSLDEILKSKFGKKIKLAKLVTLFQTPVEIKKYLKIQDHFITPLMIQSYINGTRPNHINFKPNDRETKLMYDEVYNYYNIKPTDIFNDYIIMEALYHQLHEGKKNDTIRFLQSVGWKNDRISKVMKLKLTYVNKVKTTVYGGGYNNKTNGRFSWGSGGR